MPNRSLNQIVRQILSYAEQHPVLNTVRFEPPVDFLDAGDVRFPALGFTFNGARKDGNLQTLSFTFWLWDMMLKEADNELDVWSDMNQVAADLINFLDDPDQDYQLVDSIDVRAMSCVEPDLLSGVTFDASIIMPFPSPCLQPVRAEGFLITEQGRPIYTEDGKAIKVETS